MTSLIKVAILVGGDSEERVVSEKSAAVVHKYLPEDKYDGRLVDINRDKWVDVISGVDFDKNDFSVDLGHHKWRPDVVFCAIHGSPMENGIMQGYFDIMGIPYTCCDGFVSAITMNKYLTKKILRDYEVPMAKEILLRAKLGRDLWTADAIIEHLQLPVFVKPNKHGSSFGVRKVKSIDQLLPAIDYAFEFDDEVLVESNMEGREFGNGILRVDGRLVVLPLTEIIPENEFFDFAAKYEGQSLEITPADLSEALTDKARKLTALIYEALGCSGFVRVDYILIGDTFHLIEVNTVPGLSEASIIPQQAVAHGWTLAAFFDKAVKEALHQHGNPAY